MLKITTSQYLDEIKKILLDVEIKVIPPDVMESEENVATVEIIITKNSKTHGAKLPLTESSQKPHHFIIITTNIASLITNDDKTSLELSQRIFDHFSNFKS